MNKFLRLTISLVITLPFSVLAELRQIDDGVLRYQINTATKEAAVMKCLKSSQTKEIVILDNIMTDDGKTYKVTEIMSSAFSKCKLKSIRFPVTLKTIGADAFSNCPNFYSGKKFDVPDGVKTIGMEAFYGCKFSSLSLPSSLTKVEEGAFQNTAITDVRFYKPKSSLVLEFRTFRGCKKLTSVTVPSGVSKMGQAIFADCTALTSVSLPATATTVPSMCFEDCSALKTVTLAEGITKIDFNAFAGSGIENLTLPSTIKTIGQGAFSGSSIRSVSLSKNLKAISYMMFSGCSNLTSVSIPSSVTVIESGAFYECSSLASVSIPASVKTIEQAAFYGCNRLMLVKCDASVPPSCEGTVWSDPTLDNAQLDIPTQSIDSYKQADGWSDFRWLYNSGVEMIEKVNLELQPVFYDLNGVRLPSAPSRSGLYIRETGEKREKIIIQ
ncbi:MAG: leucine-rich repeat domain-containing protein [Muribaculaceae bacterium]|nr:leucine-rich repeat domain-containing protein [Muribaculaceae bacterium]